MSQEKLKPIIEAFSQIDEARTEFATEMSHVLSELEQLCHQVQSRVAWVEQRQQQLDQDDAKWVEKLSAQIEKISGGDNDRIASMIEELTDRLDQRADAEIEAQKVSEIKHQNSRLAAELKLARTRAAQLSKTVESQQYIIDREHSMTSELSLLRQTLDTHRQLIGAIDDDSLSDDELDDALSELHET